MRPLLRLIFTGAWADVQCYADVVFFRGACDVERPTCTTPTSTPPVRGARRCSRVAVRPAGHLPNRTNRPHSPYPPLPYPVPPTDTPLPPEISPPSLPRLDRDWRRRPPPGSPVDVHRRLAPATRRTRRSCPVGLYLLFVTVVPNVLRDPRCPNPYRPNEPPPCSSPPLCPALACPALVAAATARVRPVHARRRAPLPPPQLLADRRSGRLASAVATGTSPASPGHALALAPHVLSAAAVDLRPDVPSRTVTPRAAAA
nr:vegetative cell wall protein gp1-like [Aegilops tauschii subsp. strangulata]